MTSSSIEDVKSRKFWCAVFAEFLGTLFLVFIVCGSCVLSNMNDILRISLTFGFSIATLVWNTAHVSGGHLNPAVSLGFLFTRKISILRFILYTFAQILGSCTGAAILWAIHKPGHGVIGTSMPGEGISAAETFGIELLITFVLVWTVFATVDEHRDMPGSGPLAIGISITMCHLYAVPYTGAGMNPARVFGPALISWTWDAHWVYWVGPFIGACAAAFIYEFIFAANASRAKIAGFAARDYDDKDFGPVEQSHDIKQTSPKHELHVVH